MSATDITRAAQVTELTRAADAFRNVSAVSSLLIAWFVAGLLMVLGVESGSPALIGLMGLVAIIVALAGLSAAGIHLMVQLKGLEPRSLMTGYIQGLFATGKIIVVALAVILAALIFLIPVALILLICKIPFLGPILYTFMVPVLTVAGAFVYAGLFVAWQLLGPAIWEGNTILGSIARLAGIARKRAVQVIINLIILGLLMFVAALVLGAFFGVGFGIMRSLSAGILGDQLPPGMLSQLMGQSMAFPGAVESTGHQSALRIGTSVLGALVTALLMCPLLMGLNIIYLNASEGVDTSEMENRINAGLQQAKAKAAQLQETARQKPTGPSDQSGGGASGPSTGGTGPDSAPGGPNPDNRG